MVISWLYSCYAMVCWCGAYHGIFCCGFTRRKTTEISVFCGVVDTLYHWDNCVDSTRNCVALWRSFFVVVMV